METVFAFLWRKSAIFVKPAAPPDNRFIRPTRWQDWDWWAESWAFILWAQGYRPSDRVFIPFGYNIFVAFWAGHYAAEKIGCEVVPGGVLDTQARILKDTGTQTHRDDGDPDLYAGNGRYGEK